MGVSTQCSYDPSPFKLNVMSKSLFVLKWSEKRDENEVMDYIRLKFLCRTVTFPQSERGPAKTSPYNGNNCFTEWSIGLIYTQLLSRNESRHRKGPFHVLHRKPAICIFCVCPTCQVFSS